MVSIETSPLKILKIGSIVLMGYKLSVPSIFLIYSFLLKGWATKNRIFSLVSRFSYNFCHIFFNYCLKPNYLFQLTFFYQYRKTDEICMEITRLNSKTVSLTKVHPHKTLFWQFALVKVCIRKFRYGSCLELREFGQKVKCMGNVWAFITLLDQYELKSVYDL